MMSVSTQLTPFRVEIPQAELDELMRRLNGTRWPDRETVGDQSQGRSWPRCKIWLHTGALSTTGVDSKRV